MGRDRDFFMIYDNVIISIHSPRMGRDVPPAAIKTKPALFQSTLPAWGETPWLLPGPSDPRDFNPLSPHGERQGLLFWGLTLMSFQSTLPAWGETYNFDRDQVFAIISIHSPRMGRDVIRVVSISKAQIISIHSPRMGRDWGFPYLSIDKSISIHSPRMGRDCTVAMFMLFYKDFNPLSPHGERHD